MIEYHCDKCGKKINMETEGVSLECYASALEIRNESNRNYQLCVPCFNKVKEFVSPAEKK